MFADGIDIPNVTGLGIGAMLLAFVFRTLWRQDDGWRSVLDAARSDAALAREEATAARHDAAVARVDAAVARDDAAEARMAEVECRRRLSLLEAGQESLRVAVKHSTEDHAKLKAYEEGEME